MIVYPLKILIPENNFTHRGLIQLLMVSGLEQQFFSFNNEDHYMGLINFNPEIFPAKHSIPYSQLHNVLATVHKLLVTGKRVGRHMKVAKMPVYESGCTQAHISKYSILEVIEDDILLKND